MHSSETLANPDSARKDRCFRICMGNDNPYWMENYRGVSHTILIKAYGHGSRQMCRMDEVRIRTYRTQRGQVRSWHSDRGYHQAIVTKGSKVGTYVGRVAVRTSGSFNITTAKGTVQGISFKYCWAIQRLDGYSYRLGEVFPAQPARKEDFFLPMPERQGFPKVDV